MLDLSPSFFNIIPKRDRIIDAFQFGDDIELGTLLRGVNIDNENILGEKQVSVYNKAINNIGQATDVVDLSITEAKLANLAVTTAKIRDDAVTAAKIWKGGAVITLSAQIGSGIIGSAHIGFAQINSAHIGFAQITDSHIVNLNADKINAGTITGRTLRTSASGARLEIRSVADTEAHHLIWTNDAGTPVCRIRGDVWGSITHTCASGEAHRFVTGPILAFGNIGSAANKVPNIFRTNEFACDLPTVKNACDVFRKMKRPTKEISKERKHFGEDREYFKIEDFPEEMKAENDKKELDIEMTRTLGVCVEAIKEIVEEIDKLKLEYGLRKEKKGTFRKI